MKKALLIAVLITILSIGANAQDYRTAIGFRGGIYNGLTIKHFMSQSSAFELLLATRWSGFNFTALYEVHHQAFDVSGMRWYYGIGGHVNNYNYGHAYDGFTLGIDGILGLEYSFKEIPLNISIDYKPAWNLRGYGDWWGDDGALSLRYYFN